MQRAEEIGHVDDGNLEHYVAMVMDAMEEVGVNEEPEIRSKKQSVVDVLCKDEDGCLYIIEMNVFTGGLKPLCMTQMMENTGLLP